MSRFWVNNAGKLIIITDDTQDRTSDGLIEVPVTTPSEHHYWDGTDWVLKPQTPGELRAQMLTLSSRQFWLAANTLGITEDMLLAVTDDAEIIIEIRKTTEFHRTYDSVVMLAPLMDITPEQLDDVWMWAAAV